MYLDGDQSYTPAAKTATTNDTTLPSSPISELLSSPLKEAKRKRSKLSEEERKALEEARKRRQMEQEEAKRRKLLEQEDLRQQRKAKEEERKAKEEERRLKEERQKEKDRKQLRLGLFFRKPEKSLSRPDNEPSEKAESVEVQSQTSSDYDDTFLPFHVKSNVTLFSLSPATISRLQNTSIQGIKENIDTTLLSKINQENPSSDLIIPTAKDNFSWPSGPILRQRDKKEKIASSRQIWTTKEVVGLINNAKVSEEEVRTVLAKLPRRFLRFYEDIRPPYYGTFTKANMIPRSNPFWRDDRINYDYDSEAEWVDEDDGGEVDDLEAMSDDDDGAESGIGDFIDDDDMNDFLVAEELGEEPRRRVVCPLIPVAQGVCFTDLITGENSEFDARGLEIATIHPDITLPIDPFKNYWAPADQSRKLSTMTNDVQIPTTVATKRIPEQELKAILLKIQGSDLNQLMLIETLKKEFKSISKENIRLTIKEVAKRVGNKEEDKRWIIDSTIWDRYVICNSEI
ncbi:chromatin assembly factor 1 subunit A-domain-containing protein [Dipodascopsis uninucleata]